MQSNRTELFPGVYLNYVHATKFKTGLLSAQFILPLDEKTAAFGALLPAVLHRGTETHPDMRSLSCALDLLYGAGLSFTVRKKGENQCLGFVTSFIDDAYVPSGEKLLEEASALLGEMLLRPALSGGVFREPYVAGEKGNLIDSIRAIRDDKRDYADMRLIEEMCRGERYGVMRFGSEAAVEAIDSRALYDFYQSLLSTAHVELFYCGSAAAPRVKDALARAFGALPRGKRVEPKRTERRAAPAEPRYHTETMDVSQGKLAMGFRAATEDEHAMMLANLLFGGYSNSKLFLNVREKLSLCYYASSGYHRSKGLVTVSSGVEFSDYQRAHDEILAQLRDVQLGDFEPWELESAKSVLLSAIRTREDSGARMEENTLGQAATGIWESEEEQIKALSAVTPERVAAAAKSMSLDTVYFLRGKEAVADD